MDGEPSLQLPRRQQTHQHDQVMHMAQAGTTDLILKVVQALCSTVLLLPQGLNLLLQPLTHLLALPPPLTPFAVQLLHVSPAHGIHAQGVMGLLVILQDSALCTHKLKALLPALLPPLASLAVQLLRVSPTYSSCSDAWQQSWS